MKKNQNKGSKDLSLIPLIELMPQDTVSQQILAERAKNLAMPIDEILDNKKEINYVRFKLGKSELYGISYENIKEVIMYTPPTRIPYTTESLAGIINRHGALISVLDLTRYFNLKPVTNTNGSSLIVVSAKGIIIAFLVPDIDGSDTFDPIELSPPLQFEGTINPDYIQGLHKNTIAIINVEALVTNLQLNIMHMKESR